MKPPRKSLAKVYTDAPHALHFMAQAVLPSSGWHPARGFPDLRLDWQGMRITGAQDVAIRRIALGYGACPDNATRFITPHIIGFRLLMSMVTHAEWPLPIWNALQVRNRLIVHGDIRTDVELNMTSRVIAWRVLDKGIEVDVHSRLDQCGTCPWESIVTFYYRGRFADARGFGDERGSPMVSPDGFEPSEDTPTWRVEGNERWRFCALTGDYNGVHLWDGYARLLGFPRAFSHPQRIALQCLAHLPEQVGRARMLDLWIKGQVYYGCQATLHHGGELASGLPEGSHVFALHTDRDRRPALVGRLS